MVSKKIEKSHSASTKGNLKAKKENLLLKQDSSETASASYSHAPAPTEYFLEENRMDINNERISLFGSANKENIYPHSKNLFSKRIFFAGGVFFTCLIVGLSYWYMTGFSKKVPQNELESLVVKVGSLVVLPQEETPVLATVSDVSKLTNQDFFKKAQNGDKVLVYTKSKKAYLYRPSTGQLVDVGPVNVIDPTPSPEVVAQLSVVILNGTVVNGLTRTAEEKLLASKELVRVIDRDNASVPTYEHTLIIGKDSISNTRLESLAQVFGGKVGSLPEEETMPKDADVLIILGQDFSENK